MNQGSLAGAPPRVSVIVAAFQAQEYLRNAVASALRQTFDQFEVIISDEGVDPGVEQLAASFADPRVVYRRNARPLGPAGNHWAAFAEARGAYLGILNHDDLWQPDFLATLVPILDRMQGAVLAFCDHAIIDPAGNVLPECSDRVSRQWGRDRLAPGLHRPFPELVVRQSIPLAMGSLFRRAALQPSALPDVGPAYDLWLACALCRTGGGAYYVPDRLTSWRVHPSQLTCRGVEAGAEGGLACWKAMLQDPLFGAHRRAIRRKVAANAVAVARARLAVGDRAAARRMGLLALRHHPTSWRALALLGLSFMPGSIARLALEPS
jgi:hypothetical protein